MELITTHPLPCTHACNPPTPHVHSYCAPLYVDVTKTEYTRMSDNTVDEKTETYSHVHLGKVRHGVYGRGQHGAAEAQYGIAGLPVLGL